MLRPTIPSPPTPPSDLRPLAEAQKATYKEGFTETEWPTTIIRATCKLQLVIRHETVSKNNQKRCVDGCSGCALLKELSTIRWDVTRVANHILRKLWQADGASLVDLQAVGSKVNSKTWPISMSVTEAWQEARKHAPQLLRGIASGISRAVWNKWRLERFDALVRQVKSPPHYRKTTPIPFRNNDFAFSRDAEGNYVFGFSLHSKESRREDNRHGREFRLPVMVRDEYQRTILNNIVVGEWRHGDAKLVQDRLRPSRWYLTMSYTRKVTRAAGYTFAAINRGIRNFLFAVTTSGDTLFYDGSDIEAYLAKVQARRRDIQRSVKFSGRTGRGRRRALHRATQRLSGAGERWRDNKCKTIARQFVKWCAARDISVIVLEDFKGIRDGLPESLTGGKPVWDRVQEWPYYKLYTAIKSCAQEVGILIVEVPSRNISQRCPHCGHTDKINKVLRNWRIECNECGNRMHLDEAAAWNVLDRGLQKLASGSVASSDGDNGSGSLGDGKRRRRRTVRKAPRKDPKT